MRKTFMAISRFEGDGSLKVRELNEIRHSENQPEKHENYEIFLQTQPNERRGSAPLNIIRQEQVGRRVSHQTDSQFQDSYYSRYGTTDKSFKPYHLRNVSSSKDKPEYPPLKQKHFQEGILKTDNTEDRIKRRSSKDYVQRTSHDFYENTSDPSFRRPSRKGTAQGLNGRQVINPNLSSSLAVEKTQHIRVGSESQNRQKTISSTGAMSQTYNGGSPLMNKHFQQREPAQVATYILGGFDLIDYTDTINKLHRKLLRKIQLNK